MSAAWSVWLNSAAIAVNGDPRSAIADKITAIAWRPTIFMIASPFKVHKQVILPDIFRISGPLAYIRRIPGHFESQGRAFERLGQRQIAVAAKTGHRSWWSAVARRRKRRFARSKAYLSSRRARYLTPAPLMPRLAALGAGRSATECRRRSAVALRPRPAGRSRSARD